MKKGLCVFVTVFILCILMLPTTAFAAGAQANLTGPATVRAGDKITVSLNLSGDGIYGVSGALSYDSSQVTLTGTKQKIASPWAVEFNGNNFVAYDNNLSSPINGSKTLLTATFTVKNIAVGTTIKISCNGIKTSDGKADTNVGTVTYAATVAAPLSANNDLKSLAVSNATISPAFSAGTTSYSASVPYEVSKLSVTATAADAKAKVSVNSPSLAANATTNVTITVTAENGVKKTYTISVKRAQDPNYVASSNNNLASITVDGFMLSPMFTPDVDEYLVWLPYEVDRIQVSGTAEDGNASVSVDGGNDLATGADNIVKVVCTAENGETKTYTIIAKRAAEHGKESQPAESQPVESSDSPSDTTTGIAWWWLLVVGISALAIGAVGGVIGKDYIAKKNK